MKTQKLRRARRHAVVEPLEQRQLLSTYYVSPLGDDNAAGDASAPFKTLQRAADVLLAGDTVRVLAGTYNEGVNFFGLTGGTAEHPIQFLADPGVLITHSAATGTNSTLAAINIENAGGWYIIQGFHIISDGSIERAGIRVINSNNTHVLDNTVEQAYMGIFTSHSDNLLVQGNTCINSTGQHGIYMSGAEHNCVVRGNFLAGNTWDGLHMNIVDGEPDTPNDRALVENNIIYDNSLSGIDMQGTTNATFRNNVIFGNAKHGITVHNLDQPNTPPCTGNLFVNNTIAANGMFALQMAAGGNTANTFFNNILCAGWGSYGSIGVNGATTGLVSDFNIVVDNFSMDLGFSTMRLGDWQLFTGQDTHSIVSDPFKLFRNPIGTDFYLKPGSPAIDAGVASLADKLAPAADFDGAPRPVGAAYDIGAYEWSDDTIPASISNIVIAAVKPNKVTITWSTDERATTEVDYGPTADYGSTRVDNWLWNSHSVTLTGLTPETLYHVRVRSVDRAGNVSLSEDLAVTTAPPHLTPPIISGINVWNITPTSASISWTTDEDSDSFLDYGNSTGYDNSIGDAMLRTSHRLDLAGLLPDTVYHFRVTSTDEYGNPSASEDLTFTTPTPGRLPVGATAYWPFGETGGSMVADVSGNGHGGVLQNGTTFAPGQTGNALSFDGIDDSVRILRAADLETLQISLAAWIKLAPGTQAPWATIVKKTYKDDTDAVGGSYSLCLSPEGRENILCFFTGSVYGGDQLNSTFPIPTNEWIHVAGTYDPFSGEKRLYVNGVLVASTLLSAPIAYDSTSSGDIYLGQDPGPGEAYCGLIDGVGIWNRPLTPVEIASLACPAAITLDATPGDNTFHLRLDPTGTVLQVWQNVPTTDNPTQTFPLASAGPIIINGGAGDDSVTLDLTNGSFLPSDGIHLDGGGYVLGNVLRIIGAGTKNVAYAPSAGPAAGLITIDGQSVAFFNLQNLALSGASAFSLATPANANEITINSPAPGQIRISGSSGGQPIVPLDSTDIGSLILDTTANDGTGAGDVITIGAGGVSGATLKEIGVRVGLGEGSLIIGGDVSNVDISAAGAAPFTVAVNIPTVVDLLASQELVSLNINASATVKTLGSNPPVIRTRQLKISGSGRLDLGGGCLIVQADPLTRNSVLQEIAALISSARNTTPLWQGSGISSSAAAGDSLRGLAVILNQDSSGNPLYATFNGVPVDASSILVKYTFNGDANLDGKLDASDYFLIDRGFLSKTSSNPLTGYRNGDFDYNGKIDASDYFLIDKAFLSQTAKPPAIAPAPIAAAAQPRRSPKRHTLHRNPRPAAKSDKYSVLVKRPLGSNSARASALNSF